MICHGIPDFREIQDGGECWTVLLLLRQISYGQLTCPTVITDTILGNAQILLTWTLQPTIVVATMEI